MTTFGVTAASGRLGRLVVESLLGKGVSAGDIIAIARTEGKIADLAERGVVVRYGDYTLPETVADALDGVERLLLISGTDFGSRVVQHANVIAAAKETGVVRICYTSLLHAERTTIPIAAEHRGTENVLAASGIDHTLLRNGWYTENYTEHIDEYLAAGEIVGATGEGRISAAPRADYAEAAAVALLGDEGERTVYELGGESFTMAGLAETIAQVTGAAVAYRNLTPEERMAELREAGLDQGSAAMVAAMDVAIAAGALEADSDRLESLLGRPPTPLAEVVRVACGAA